MKRKLNRILSILLAIVIVAGGMVLPAGNKAKASMEFDTTNAVRFKAFASRHEIANSMIFIGTHLIYLDAATEELWQMALDSQNPSNQYNIYYKSELGDGQWFDITDAGSINDISTEGELVDEEQLADLYVTHYTFIDGITKDAKTGDTINIFDDPDPYDLYNLKELDSIRTQYDMIDQKESLTDSDEHNIKWTLDLLWQADLQNAATKKCDKQLKSLNKLYKSLLQEDDQDQAAIVYTLMSKVDAARRAEVFRQLCEDEDCILNELINKYNGESFDDDDYIVNSELIDAWGEAFGLCAESYTEYSGKGLIKGESVLKEAEYKYSERIIKDAEKGTTPQTGTNLNKLKWIFNIEDDVIEATAEEIALLDDELIPAAVSNYSSALKSEPSSKYKKAVSANRSNAVKETILKEQQDKINQERVALQYLLSAKFKRLSAQEATEYIFERIDWADSQYSVIPATDLSDLAKATVSQHIAWLTEEAKKIKAENTVITSEFDELTNKKKDLVLQQEMALDDNDLKTAKEIGAQIDAIDKQISDAEGELSGILNDKDASAADKAKAGVDLGDDTLTGFLNSIKDRAIGNVTADDLDSLQADVECLAALGAYSQLNEILAAVKDNDGTIKTKRMLRQAKKTAKKSELYKAADTKEEVDKSGITQTALLDALEAYFGNGFDSLSAGDQIIAVYALNMLGDDGVAAAKSLASTYVTRAANAKNGYVYETLAEATDVDYVELKALAKAADCRYIYSDSKKVATLTKKNKVYIFSVGSASMEDKDGKNTKLKGEVIMQNRPYASYDAAEALKCSSAYVKRSNYCVVLSDSMKKKAETLYSELKGGE